MCIIRIWFTWRQKTWFVSRRRTRLPLSSADWISDSNSLSCALLQSCEHLILADNDEHFSTVQHQRQVHFNHVICILNKFVSPLLDILRVYVRVYCISCSSIQLCWYEESHNDVCITFKDDISVTNNTGNGKFSLLWWLILSASS